MAEIRASFFIECEELLEALQDGLQVIEDGADDPETINVVFRAVHSIKGGAGAFGLEALVRFAHRFETVLDEVRAGRLTIANDALKVFFQAADHLSDLVRISRDGSDAPEAETILLLNALDAFLGDTPTDEGAQDAPIEFKPMGLSLDLDLGEAQDDDGIDLADLDALPPPPIFGAAPEEAEFLIRFTPLPELFETGNEPALLLRNLGRLGEMEVTCDATALPDLDKLAPDVPHLSWTITLRTEVDENEVRSVFEFVEGLCVLEVTSTSGDGTMSPSPAAAEIERADLHPV